jgi:hypothetical protein
MDGDCLSARGGGDVFREPIGNRSSVRLRERTRRQEMARALDPDQIALRRRCQADINRLSVRREGKLVFLAVNHQGGNFDLRSVLDRARRARGARNPRSYEIAFNWNVSGTRDFSFAKRNLGYSVAFVSE